MIRNLIIALTVTMTMLNSASAQMNETAIRHTVAFKLKHQKSSPQEQDFIAALNKLSDIPGVKNFSLMNEISKKNKFDYILAMDFDTQQAYDQYNEHPDHVAFVQSRWLKEVEEFMEIDYGINK